MRVDRSALLRGHTVSGEICEILDAGPVPVGTVRQWMRQPDAFVAALLVEGSEVTRVAKVGRRIPARLVTALKERDRCCVLPGCGRIHDLQIDHVVGIEGGGPTTLYNLARLCAKHHYLKTHHGYVLKRRLGHWLWEDPGGLPPELDQLQQELTAARCEETLAAPCGVLAPA